MPCYVARIACMERLGWESRSYEWTPNAPCRDFVDERLGNELRKYVSSETVAELEVSRIAPGKYRLSIELRSGEPSPEVFLALELRSSQGDALRTLLYARRVLVGIALSKLARSLASRLRLPPAVGIAWDDPLESPFAPVVGAETVMLSAKLWNCVGALPLAEVSVLAPLIIDKRSLALRGAKVMSAEYMEKHLRVVASEREIEALRELGEFVSRVLAVVDPQLQNLASGERAPSSLTPWDLRALSNPATRVVIFTTAPLCGRVGSSGVGDVFMDLRAALERVARGESVYVTLYSPTTSTALTICRYPPEVGDGERVLDRGRGRLLA